MSTRSERRALVTFTEQERKFIEYYTTVEPNGMKAARAAGYKDPREMQGRLMKRPVVVAEINRRQLRAQKNEAFNIDNLMDWSVFGATYDIGDIFKEGTFEIMPPSEWKNPRMRRMCESIRTITTVDEKGKERTTCEVRFASRHPHLDRLAALMGVRKHLDIQVNTRTIPLEVIDKLTRETKADIETTATNVTKTAKRKRLSIAEIDAKTRSEKAKGESRKLESPEDIG